MKIIRWLLSHTLLILLIIAVIYGYMFWGNLAGEDTPAGKALAYLSSEFVEVEQFIAAVKAKQAQLTEEKQPVHVAKSDQPIEAGNNAAKQSAAITNDNYQQQAAAPSTANASQAGTEKAQINKPVIAIANVKQQENIASTNQQVEAAPGNTQPGPVAIAKSNTSDRFVSAEVASQLDNVDKHGKVINTSQQNDAIKSLWITARKSYYQRNYKLSEQSYQQVIDKTNDNVDAYGELGNVYFNQGKNKEAASAYFEAAAILIRNGQANRARSLIGLLRHLDKTKADELKQLIDSSLS